MIKSYNLTQGNSEWHAFRAEHFGASEASAMLGISPYKNRNELLAEKKTGLTKDVDYATQKVFDKGHEVESLARPIVEKMIGEELSPITFSNGKLSASSDGVTFMGDIAWETKQFNKAHFEQVKNGELPEIHWPQCQQVLFCSGAKKLFFTISDGTEENTVGVWVHDDPELQAKIVNGWAQFEKDLAAYVPVEVIEKPKAVTILALPSLAIQIRGEVTLSNLPEFKQAATAYIASINTDFVTDEDFSNGEAAAKFCKDAEENIELTKNAAIAQTASIDELMRTLDFIKGQLRDKRLIIEKLVSSEKENRKLSIINEGKKVLASHIWDLNLEIEPLTLPSINADFASAIKGKKTLSSMQDAVDTELARCKIEADKIALDIRSKKALMDEFATGYTFLFNDLQTIIYKPMDDFSLLLHSRIAEHKRSLVEREATIKAQAEAEARAKVEAESKCDGNHGGNPCGDKECWQLDAPKGSTEEAYSPNLALDEVMAAASPVKLAAVSKRPTVHQIIEVLAMHYGVHESTVIGWLGEMDLKAAINRMATA